MILAFYRFVLFIIIPNVFTEPQYGPISLDVCDIQSEKFEIERLKC